MKKKIFTLLALCLLAQWSVAQVAKWADKAKRAVFSIVTYDSDNKRLNTGNGFFITDDGIALSDYALFKGAKRAVVITADGLQMPVDAIMGANDMYDVIKFRVDTSGKKISALQVSAVAPVVGSEIYLLPYSTQKDRTVTTGRVNEIDKVSSQYNYYTLALQLKDKMVSCPLVTADGQVFALAQKSTGKDSTTVCYGIDASFAMNLTITALSYNDSSLKNLDIKKALPDTEEQALAFLYMASSQLTPEKYMAVLDDFIAEYPNNSDGYIRRAYLQLQLSNDRASVDKAAADMDKALTVADRKDDVYYNRSKIIYTYVLGHGDTYKDWTFSKALDEIRKAIAVDRLPIYVQSEGDVLFAMQDYSSAYDSYAEVNHTNLASPVTYFSAARSKQLMQAPADEVLALMDSCVACFTKPYTAEAAPYLLERAQVRMEANQARNAMLDYDAYYDAVNGKVNDTFYYYRAQAALKGKQYQRALDDMASAIELSPNDLTYRAELAVINIRVGRNDEALTILQSALQIDPTYAEAYRLMGIAQIQLGQKDAACTSFAKAKELGDTAVDPLIEKHCK